ncbi:hypothetical protein GUJ93_ZPchr0007g6237 [Zizania palustris]|uniref:Uncharacterized protein n=1 Tax=Zizania palustris TaxID=103762 RepID=A0A8J5TCK1_ZIZPA|nr:hypothetical protein GUJ93_ZPchr0007g6237 [Zizania palustris]
MVPATIVPVAIGLKVSGDAFATRGVNSSYFSINPTDVCCAVRAHDVRGLQADENFRREAAAIKLNPRKDERGGVAMHDHIDRAEEDGCASRTPRRLCGSDAPIDSDTHRPVWPFDLPSRPSRGHLPHEGNNSAGEPSPRNTSETACHAMPCHVTSWQSLAGRLDGVVNFLNGHGRSEAVMLCRVRAALRSEVYESESERSVKLLSGALWK